MIIYQFCMPSKRGIVPRLLGMFVCRNESGRD